MKRSYKIVVTGTVQGVGFRMHTRRQAQSLRITGWVKNQPDGSVLISAEGEEHDLELFLQWCHKGPDNARVQEVEVLDQPVKGYGHFDVRY
jgi:acylphosphatase